MSDLDEAAIRRRVDDLPDGMSDSEAVAAIIKDVGRQIAWKLHEREELLRASNPDSYVRNRMDELEVIEQRVREWTGAEREDTNG